MAKSLRQAIAPVYLLLCLTLGGSAQGIFGNMILQLLGLGIIGWAAIEPADEPLVRPARQLLWIVLIALAVVALQLIPLPASLWPSLGGRAELADGYRVLGLGIPPLPISLAPYDSLATLLKLIPPIALFCAIARLKAYRYSWLALALVGGTLAGVLLGALQVATAASSPAWYPYSHSSFGFATGFFANANHMAILLVIALPFLAALLASVGGDNVQRYSAAVALVAGAVLVILVGIALNRSLAAYGFSIPVLVASVLIVVPARSAMRRGIAAGSVGLLLAAMAALVLTPVGGKALGASTSVTSRATMNATTLRAIEGFMPLGSGLGTFEDVYRLYERPEQIVNQTFVNHAHNDYAEIALETGLPGIILMLVFLAWWAAAARRVWRTADAGPYARAASIASAAILAHSLVDFPLRTAAVSAAFAMCLAFMVTKQARPSSRRSDLWPTRHVDLG